MQGQARFSHYRARPGSPTAGPGQVVPLQGQARFSHCRARPDGPTGPGQVLSLQGQARFFLLVVWGSVRISHKSVANRMDVWLNRRSPVDQKRAEAYPISVSRKRKSPLLLVMVH